jgi:predicted acetyltransferase
VIEAMGDAPEATRAIWRYLCDIDWLARVKAWLLPLDHPLLLLMAEPRRLGFNCRDGLWVRVLDVKAALSARSYQTQGSLVIEVTDEFCPWNAGCWKIGSDRVERTDEAPSLRCDITALGSVYLGGFTWRSLRALCALLSWFPAPSRSLTPSSKRPGRLGVLKFFDSWA